MASTRLPPSSRGASLLEDTRPEYTASRLVRRCRLEATTSRLEDLASLATTYLPPSAQGAASAITSPASANAEQPTPVPPPPPPPAAAAPAQDPRSVVAFDEQIIDGKLKPFVELTKSFASPSVIEQVRTMYYRSGTRHSCTLRGVSFASVWCRLAWSSKSSRTCASCCSSLGRARSPIRANSRSCWALCKRTSRRSRGRRRPTGRIGNGSIIFRPLRRARRVLAGSQW